MSSKVIHNLVKRSQKGDAEAFGELYSFFADDMYRFAYYYTSSPEYAEDAVSEAVLNAFENIRALKKSESFKSWLFKILFNCCKQKQREKALRKSQSDIESIINISVKTDDMDEKLSLEKALARLGDEERQIILLSFACGYKSEETAAILGLNASTVRSKQARAIGKLRTMLSKA